MCRVCFIILIMKIEIDHVSQQQKRIVSYSTQGFIVNDEEFNTNIVINTNNVVKTPLLNDVEQLVLVDLHEVLALNPEILLVGTGKMHKYLKQSLIAELEQQNIGVSTMDTGAACRAYNVLLAESRKVVALLYKLEE